MREPPRLHETGNMHVPGTTLRPAGRPDYQLVLDHLPLVERAVTDLSRRLPQHVRTDELYSAGMLGLAQAARSFDPDRGIAFEHHASTRIRGALLDELRYADWASRSVRTRARRLQRIADDLTSRLGRPPSPAQLAHELGVEVEAVHRLLDDVHRATVLNYDSIVEQGGDELLPAGGDPPESVLLDRERRAYLVDAVLALPGRLRHVVVASFFEERPMHHIAAELGVTESRVSQLRAEALALLRDGLNAQLDPEALAPEPRPRGRPARRRAAYYAAIAAASDYRARLAAEPRPALAAAARPR
jgi:RNA polymerase sigma factor for flagellar operon FliA